MTTSTQTLVSGPPPSTARRRRPRSRRWLRAAIPFLVLLTVWLGTAVVHAIEEPDLDDAGTLSPSGTGAHGSSRLADLLRGQGVTVDRATSSTQALQMATTGADTTIFIPTPDYLNPEFFARASATPGVSRVVVVQPGLRTLINAGLPIGAGFGRWVTHNARADCSTSSFGHDSVAAVDDSSYAFDQYYSSFAKPSMECFHGSVLGVRTGSIETVYVGANDLFRNDRIDELDNAAVAVGLLSGHPRVIWADVHTQEPVAYQVPKFALPNYRRPGQNRGDSGSPILDAFPSWLWAGFVLTGASAVLLAVARARRLGPPVAEPLPVVVPAAESVTGRGRLYERIAARESTLDTLRMAAIGRMAPALYPFGTAPPERELVRGAAAAEQLVAHIAQRIGETDDDVRDILYGQPPVGDQDLAVAVAHLDALVAAVLTPHSRPTDPHQGANR